MIPQRHNRNTSRASLFVPSKLGKVSAWLSVPRSTPAAGEYDSLFDVLNSNPTNQPGTARRPAAGTSTNGSVALTWDGTDVLVYPLLAGKTDLTTKFGVACWVKFASVASTQLIYARFNGPNATTQRVIQTGIVATGAMMTAAWISTAAGTGRNIFSAGGVVPANAWVFFRSSYNSSVGGDGCVAHFLNGASIPQSGNTNIGAGGTLGALQAATGNAFIGAQSDSDTPTGALSNGTQIGSNIYILNDDLTSQEEILLMNYQRPE